VLVVTVAPQGLSGFLRFNRRAPRGTTVEPAVAVE
jgi:hypothetical protein